MANFDVEQLRAMLANYDAEGAGEGSGEQPPANNNNDDPAQNAAGEQNQPAGQQLVPNPADQQEKDANAFAQMRMQNKMMGDMLAKIAQANNIQYNGVDDLMAKLNDDTITKMATQQGVDPALLKRMDDLERDAQAYRQQQTQNNLINAFASLQKEFNLSAEDLSNFAKELDNSGIPVESVNVRNEFMSRHLDSIIAARTDAAVQAALTRDAAAATQSTQPLGAGTLGTGTGHQPRQINSVAEMRAFLSQLDNK